MSSTSKSRKSAAPTAAEVPAKSVAGAAKPAASGKRSAKAASRTSAAKAAAGAPATEQLLELGQVQLPDGYQPSADDEYMNPAHLEYFRRKLLTWRDELIEESKQTIENLRDEVRDVGDEAERATREAENTLELRTRDRYRKLLSKIQKALARIEDGSYGYCEETGEPIGLARLDARPIASLSLDAQERREHRERLMSD